MPGRDSDVLKRGERFTGIWSGRTYRVLRKLGKSASGEMYLVHSDAGILVMNISGRLQEIAGESRMLQYLKAESRGVSPGSPSVPASSLVVEYDQCVIRGNHYGFYVILTSDAMQKAVPFSLRMLGNAVSRDICFPARKPFTWDWTDWSLVVALAAFAATVSFLVAHG
jgi:hypothetical protein